MPAETNERRQFLYQIQPTRPEMLQEGLTEREAEIMGRHFAYLKSNMEQGVLILAGRTLNTDPDTFGIGIFNATSEEEAWEFVKNDPAVKEGVMHARLFPYRVALISEANAR